MFRCFLKGSRYLLIQSLFMRDFVSFDIFDTCLCRSCGSPQNVFTLLAYKALGSNSSISEISDFRYIRIQGEIEARKCSRKDDITIQEIYEKCDFSVFPNLLKDDLIQLEMEIEESVLFPIKKAQNIISQARQEGSRILFISDMYLPSSFLKRVLYKYNIFKEGDTLFVSGEIGKSKAKASLFKYIADKENISFKHWEHFGDNFFSDVLMPIKLGIKSHWRKVGYTKIQSFYRKNDIGLNDDTLSCNAAISHAIQVEEKDSIYVQFAADLIAPLYVPFVYHVLQDASKRGIRKLYFLSRDGYILYQIAKIFYRHFPNIELKYLHVSRKSLYYPGLDQLNSESLMLLFAGKSKNGILEELDNLHIDNKELICKIQTAEQVVPLLQQYGYTLHYINEEIAKQKELCLNYFIQEGLADKTVKSAIVDLRGTRKCQCMINNILNTSGYPSCFAYYMEVTYNRIIPKGNIDYDALIYGDHLLDKSNYKYYSYTLYLLEHYFSLTGFSRVSSYCKVSEEKYAVNYDNDKVEPASIFISNVNIRICQKYAERFITNIALINSGSLFQYATKSLVNFVQSPDRHYLKALICIDTSESQLTPKILIDKLSLKHIRQRDLSWFDGAVMLTFGKIPFIIFKFIFRRCIPLLRNLL